MPKTAKTGTPKPKKNNAFDPIAETFQQVAANRHWTLDASGLVATSPHGWLTLRCSHNVVCAAAMPILSCITFSSRWARNSSNNHSYVQKHDSAADTQHLSAVTKDFQSTEALYTFFMEYEGLIAYPMALTAAQSRVLSRLQAGEVLVEARKRWSYSSTRYTVGDLEVAPNIVDALRSAGIITYQHRELVTNASARAEWNTRNGMS